MNTESKKTILDLFGAMVGTRTGKLDLRFVSQGFVTNFVPSINDASVLREKYRPIDMRTLFTVNERNKSSVVELLTKQILHYWIPGSEPSDGFFNLEQTNGTIVTVNFVRAITTEELGDMVRKLLYTNAPVKDTKAIANLVKDLSIEYDITKVQNNELRVALFDPLNDTFTNGDDVVRWMCYFATGDLLLIKSKEVLTAIKNAAGIYDTFLLQRHENVLAEVFHRHKNIILAAKTVKNRAVINRISRLAKVLHKPITPSISKNFLSLALYNQIRDIDHVLDTHISIRDKMKFLNLIAWKSMGASAMDVFIIRNGKAHIEKGRPEYLPEMLEKVERHILESIRRDFERLGLYQKKILLDGNVDYGLPISRKQTMGNLPFGTTVSTDSIRISAGIYWENAWGARDLDLSMISISGSRIGWGQFSGYDAENPVKFSGDIVDAPKGAMEFMTALRNDKTPFGLFVNIFNGGVGASCEIVVGEQNKVHKAANTRWISPTIIREKVKLNAKGNIVGFIKNGNFIVYSLQTNGNAISGGSKEQILIQKALGSVWTISKLFSVLDVKYDVDSTLQDEYDVDLSYSGFSLDKLEAVFN